MTPETRSPELSVEQRLERIERTLSLLLENQVAQQDVLRTVAEVPNVVATVTDVADGLFGRLIARGVDPVQLGRNVTTALERLVDLLHSDEVSTFLDSGMLDPSTVRFLGEVGSAFAATRDEEGGRAGMFAALGGVREEPVQRALDFGLRFARRFGGLVSDRRLPR